MNILALDLSTHTGWAYFEDGKLISVGKFDVKIENYINELRSYKDIPKGYPYNFIDVAIKVSKFCLQLWFDLGKPYIVTEHTEGSKHRISQRTLEFMHFAVFNEFRDYRGVNFKYILNSDWRRATNCYISQWPELKKFNAKVAKLKKTAKRTKSGARVAKIDGKIVSPWDAKKLSMKLAKEFYPDLAVQITDDNVSDAVLQGRSAISLKLFEE